MRVLHVGRFLKDPHPCNIHPNKLISTLERFCPDWQNHKIHRDTMDARAFSKHGIPDLILIHYAERAVDAIYRLRDMFPKTPIVAHVWGHDWWEWMEAPCIWRALSSVDMILAKFPDSVIEHLPEHPPYVEMRHLVDERIFCIGGGIHKTIPIFYARGLGWNDSQTYWPNEVAAAGMALHFLYGTPTITDGLSSPREFAETLRKSQCVVSLREDAGPAYTTVEAALCGAIPVVSDVPDIRKEFTDDGKVVGARLAVKDPDSIVEAVMAVMKLTDREYLSEVKRNFRHFSNWTQAANGPRLAMELTRLVAQGVK